MAATDVPSPTCPGCQQPPLYLLGDDDQAFCGSDDCNVIIWNPKLPLEQLMAEAEHVRVTERRLCPVHNMPDCSPLLNGCSRLTAHPKPDR